MLSNLFFFNDTATTEIYTLSLHDALPIWLILRCPPPTGPGSEEIAELEVQFPAGVRPPEAVGAVEAIRPVDADRTERRDDADADAGAAEQPGGIELAGARPHVPGIVERRHIEHLRQPS